jgi:hypothetical protein
MLLKLLDKIERGGMLPNSLYKVSITLITKTNKHITKMKTTPICFMSIDTEILNKILSNEIQQ